MRHFKYLLLIPLFFITGCSKSVTDTDGEGQSVVPSIEVTVTDIENNCATISVTMTSGTASSGRIVKNLPLTDVQFNYENEIQLVNYVKENGEEISIPHTVTLNELRNGEQFITAVIALNSDGSATSSDYKIWTAEGAEESWSDDGNTGDHGEVKW